MSRLRGDQESTPAALPPEYIGILKEGYVPSRCLHADWLQPGRCPGWTAYMGSDSSHGDSCVRTPEHKQTTGPPLFPVEMEITEVVSVGERKGTNVHSEPLWGPLLLGAFLPVSCALTSPAHTSHYTSSKRRGWEVTESTFIYFEVFEMPRSCPLSLTLTQVLLDCLTWLAGGRGGWHTVRCQVCWRGRSTQPQGSLCGCLPGLALGVYFGIGWRRAMSLFPGVKR